MLVARTPDANWALDTIDRRSISDYSFFFEGSLVSWSAVKQKFIAPSSTEAEYYAMTHAFKEALLLHDFLSTLHFPPPPILFPFFLIIRPLVLFYILRLIWPDPNTLIPVTISFELMSMMALLLLLGFLLQACLLIYLLNLCLLFFFFAIAPSFDSPFLLLSLNLFLFVLLGVCWTSQDVTTHDLSRGLRGLLI